MKTRRSHLTVLLAAFVILCGGRAQSAPADSGLTITTNGKTDYVIVKPDAPTPVDEYAVRILAEGLKKKTGVDFPVRDAAGAPAQRRIYVGTSAASLRDRDADPRPALRDQQWVARSVGPDIFLYGKGVHGTLYAVVDFLDASLGRKWCADYYGEKPAFTRVDALELKPFERSRTPSFAYRMLGMPNEFNYQYGFNICLPEEVCKGFGMPAGTLPAFENPVWVHTSFLYMPPYPGSSFEWLKGTGYFDKHPEFYSQNQNGQRVAEQLCYGSPGLRAQLTTNILTHIAVIRKTKTDDRPIMIALDQEDPATGKFCHCDKCVALEARYGCPAGAFFDYLIELCTPLKVSQPDVVVKTIAYRKSQTLLPPSMPDGVAFPDNVIVVFCGVEDVINKTWKDPENRDTYKYLQGWARLTPHVWVWNYHIYSAGLLMPFSNIERMALEMKMAKEIAAEGIFLEMYPEGGFNDLLQYLFLKLAQDVDADVKTLVKTFCEVLYGPAATLAEQYVWELEAASHTGKKDMEIIHSVVDFDGPFSYLTPERLHRWQKLFDEMNRLAVEAELPQKGLVANDDRLQKNVRRLRRNVDLATLARWHDLAKSHPDYYTDYTVVKDRLGMLSLVRASWVNDWIMKIQAGDVHKPLPSALDGVPKADVSEFIPSNKAGKDRVKSVLDPDAAFGYATTISDPDVPFNFGFHQNDKGQAVALRLEQKDIVPGVWQLHKLAAIQLTPNCLIWFSSRSWMTNLELGGMFRPDSSNLFDAYVSLKFAGKGYGGEGENQVLCDRIILVRKHP